VEWAAARLTGGEGLAVRASKKLRSDEALITTFGATRLRMELDKIPLWRSDHVAVKQLAEDFAKYLYLPRLKGPSVLMAAVASGVGLLSWEQESFAYAESYDEGAGRYRGLEYGKAIDPPDPDGPGVLVKPAVARAQIDRERPTPSAPTSAGPTAPSASAPTRGTGKGSTPQPLARRYHASVSLDAMRVGLGASRVAEEVITHLAGLDGADVRVTLEIQADIPNGAPEDVVRTVTENGRTLKFTSQGFESE
jgi:hypothetical protein